MLFPDFDYSVTGFRIERLQEVLKFRRRQGQNVFRVYYFPHT